MLVTVEGLTKHFVSRRGAAVVAVDDVSLSIQRGETVGLVGESGCGKSTVGRCILRLVDVDSGAIVFDGTRIDKLSARELRPVRRRMQMVFQDPLGSTNPAFTLRHTLEDALRQADVNGPERERRMLELLDSVGLSPRLLDRRRGELSGGQLQRGTIARALAPEPDFIFLDEPTSALDMSIRGQIVNLLADLQDARGIAFLFASHDLGVVRALAHRVIVMYLGRVVEAGPVEEVLQAPSHPYTMALLAASTDLDDIAADGDLVVGEPPAEPDRSGCRYADRCPFVHERCSAEPPLFDVAAGRISRCWLSDNAVSIPLELKPRFRQSHKGDTRDG